MSALYILSILLFSVSSASVLNRTRLEGGLEGIIITGGKNTFENVEVYIPPIGPYPSFQCQMLPMSHGRFSHSQQGLQACGGGNKEDQVTCETWKDGQWVITHELMRVRFEHSAYNSPDGLILMGSSDYPGNIKTVMLEKDAVVGDDVPDTHGWYDLPYGVAGQCAIPEPDTNTVVLTGSQVARFGPGGLLAYLPNLNQNRMNHACGGYSDADGSKVMLVAGGWLGGSDIIDSVEIRVGDGDAPWVFSTPLPAQMKGNRIANLGNVLYHMGGVNGNGIYKWEANSKEWIHLDDIINPRMKHAVSVITVDDSILDFCFGK